MKTDDATLELLKRIAKAMAAQFGGNCEVAVHDLSANDPENTIAAIENGHVSNRSVGEGSSPIVLEAMKNGATHMQDKYCYLTKTSDGRTLRSSTVYINDQAGRPTGILSINYDMTALMMTKATVDAMVDDGRETGDTARIPANVNELLDDLIEKSVRMTGKPVALMNKDDKVKAIKYLNDAGAMLITKSGDRIAGYFGISKYTLYSYIDSGGGGK